ncbi:MAG: hypothetical protein WCB98_01590 [Candidatus Aquirickettsiella gammari]
MFKKFLASMSMLLLVVSGLAGCSKPQGSDQSGDTVVPPVQEQMANPANSSTSDEQMPVNPQAAEPAQTPPSADTTPAQGSTDMKNASKDMKDGVKNEMKDMKDGVKNDMKDMKDGTTSMAPTSHNDNNSGATGG